MLDTPQARHPRGAVWTYLNKATCFPLLEQRVCLWGHISAHLTLSLTKRLEVSLNDTAPNITNGLSDAISSPQDGQTSLRD